MSTQNQIDILSSPNINQECVINVTKENIDFIDQKAKIECKILNFSSDWNFEDVVSKIPTLDVKAYPLLFIFVIDIKGNEFCGSLNFLKSSLVNFIKSRPLVLQLTSSKENLTKIYYKDEACNEFCEVNREATDVTDFNDFPSFLICYLSRKIDNFEDVMLDKIPNIKNSASILKFLRTLKLSVEFVSELVLECATYGSESDLLATVDGFYDSTGMINGPDVNFFLSYKFWSTSVIYTAVEKPNQPIISFLLKKCSIWIQQLPFDHQNEISTAAFTSGQLDVLCDLLEFCDFPFPKDFNPESVVHKRLRKIIDDRIQFHADVLAENRQKIGDFIEDNCNLKFAFSVDNKSAIGMALESKKFATFTFLKSNRFRDNEIEDINIEYLTNEEDKKSARHFAFVQTRRNVNISNFDEDLSVQQLAMRSLIYNRDEINPLEQEQREKIKKWYSEIYKTEFGSKLIDAVVQCKDLKIIFDFECESTENVDVLSTSASLGATITSCAWIFIGAKLTKESQREQEIKGVVAHEICHYVMRLVYQNKENPYYEWNEQSLIELENIVTEIELLLFPLTAQKDPLDDKCKGIISTVYTLYPRKDWHPEIIVRPAQIQAQFDDNEEKIKELKEMYKNLFNFFKQFVLPEMKKLCLQKRANIQMFNDCIGILSELRNSSIKLKPKINLSEMLSNNSAIITSNIPKLLLLDIFNSLTEKYKDLLEVKNIFIAPENLGKSSVFEKLDNILKEKLNLNFFVDCTKECERSFQINLGKDSKLFFITSNENQNQKDISNINEQGTIQPNMTQNYNWMDLPAESQQVLLQIKISFQNNSTFSLSELILKRTDKQQPESTLNKDLKIIIDDQLLNLLVEKSEIKINPTTLENIEDKKFRILFQTRNLIKKIEHLKTSEKEMSQLRMLEDIKDKKFVLISDKAGSGKSWILKNFTNQLRNMFPSKWTTYVDLKHFIGTFKPQDTKIEFAAFMADNILKLSTNFEAEIFKKLYKNGKVCILFDGFDEIAPDYAEFVTKLFQSFQQNGGNQLWIATRDYFEVDLQKKLRLDAVYKLDEFTAKHGVELIASSWVLSEIMQDHKTLMETDTVKTSSNLQEYKKTAKNLIEKIPKTQYNSIGLPQFYKMIADITQKNKEAAIVFTLFKIFEECVNIQCKIWSQQKGELRSKANTQSHDMELNYQKLHQFVAMKSLFPKDSQLCDLNIEDLKDWIDEEIIGCGMLTKKGGIFLFSHETFREYFVAKFILRILMKPGTRDDDQVCGYLIKILTVWKFGTIRMFLNEALAEKSTLVKIERKIPKINENFCQNAKKLENLDNAFRENLENLAEFLLKIFENKNYDKMKDILLKNKNIFPASTECKLLFTKVRAFVMRYFKGNDFKDFWSNNEIFLQIFESSHDIQTINEFLEASKEKTDSNFIKKSLRMKHSYSDENLFFYLFRSDKFSSEFFQQVIQILKAYLNMNEIIELVTECNNVRYNILHECVGLKNARKLEDLWNSLELLFKSENNSEEFKKILSQKASGYGSNQGNNTFHSSTKCEEIEFHETFWRLLLNTFKKQKDLLNLIMQRDGDGNNYVHCLIIRNKPDIIEFSFEKIKEKFSNDQYEKILKSRGGCGWNLLHTAACKSNDIKTYQILWKIFQDFYKSDEKLLEFIKDVDKNGHNVLHIAADFTSKEIFEFMIKELEKIAPNEEIRNILDKLGMENTNLLQSAASQNESNEFHEYLWTIMRKYFSSREVLDMINHKDKYGHNLLFYVVKWNTKQILELTWSEIKNVFNKTQKNSSIQQYFSCLRNNKENMLHILIKRGNSEQLKYFWSELESYFTKQQLRELMNLKTLKHKQNVLHLAAKCNKLEFHETLWELLVKTFENREELKDLIMQNDEDEDNYVHCLVKFRIASVIEFNFKKLREIFNDDDYEEILNSKGYSNISLIQSVAKFHKSSKVHQTLWKIYREYFNDSQMFDIIKYTDDFGNIILTYAIEEKQKKMVKFIWKEIREILTHAECFSQTLSSHLNEFEEILKILFKNPLDTEKMIMMKSMWNKFVEEFELCDSRKQMEQILSKELSVKDVKNLNRLALCDKLEHHEALWRMLLNNFENKDKLKDLILKKDLNENNFLHILVLKDNPDIIEFTLSILKNHFNDEQFREILQSKGKLERNLLHIAAQNIKSIKIHQILWKIFREFCKSDQEFLEFIKEVDKNRSNVVHIAASASTAAIFEFMIETLEKVTTEKDEIKNLLSTFGCCDGNIFHATTLNKSLELHEKLWEIIQKYFNSSEILQIINYCGKYDDNILHTAVTWNTKEIVEYTWNQIKKFIQTKEEQTKYLKREGHYSYDLLQMSLENQAKDPDVHTWVENLLTEYEISFKQEDDSDSDEEDDSGSDEEDDSDSYEEDDSDSDEEDDSDSDEEDDSGSDEKYDSDAFSI